MSAAAAPGECAATGVGARLREALAGRRFVVVTNREPYEHHWGERPVGLAIRRPAGGLTSALDPVMQAVGGTWVAWGSGDADAAAVDGADHVRVPPENPKYVLRRVWLTEHDLRRYYLGYSNQLLWPLCHIRPDLVRLDPTHWDRYQQVNRRFAEATLAEVEGGAAAIWFQDYHLALAPRLVRERRPDAALSQFWHIPFPPPEIFHMAPQAEALLRGLLANDLLGFQVARFAENFLRCVTGLAGVEVDPVAATATLGGHTCHVRSFPISTDVEGFRDAAGGATAECARLRARFAPAGGAIGLGVDRMDYSKGLVEKLAALELLWEENPDLLGRFTFVQIAVPSRLAIEPYDRLCAEVRERAEAINARFGGPHWTPVHLIGEAVSGDALAAFYRMADLCLVTSLQDGMNLVAKEYVASQVEGAGVLVLSAFAGAALELRQATLVNPHDPRAVAQAIRAGLAAPLAERSAAMRAMQRELRSIYDWMAEVVAAWEPLMDAERRRRPPTPGDGG